MDHSKALNTGRATSGPELSGSDCETGGTASWPPIALLACPDCRGELRRDDRRLICDACPAVFDQSDDRAVALFARRSMASDDWQRRQAMMFEWYGELAGDDRQSLYCFRHDYEPLRSLLQSLAGRVLDVGGGIGVTRHYLDAAVEYINLEPGAFWLQLDTTPLRAQFPCLANPPTTVLGSGERLPFRDASFDAVLSLWSLNHAEDPRQVVAEMARVVRPTGQLILTLEDMVPSWLDIARSVVDRRRPMGNVSAQRLVRQKVAATVFGRPWPLQADHVRIDEADLRAWMRPLQLKRRFWFHRYLVTIWTSGLRTSADRGEESAP